MAYNNGREDRKWRIWKEAEEKVLREHGVDETTIEQIRIDDRADFNSNRRFYHWTSDFGEYLEGMADKEQSSEIKTVTDLLDEIEDENLYQACITFRLSEEEHEKLKQYSSACGLSAAEFMRQLCRGNAPQPMPQTEFWELLGKLYEVHDAFRKCVPFYPAAAEICKEIAPVIAEIPYDAFFVEYDDARSGSFAPWSVLKDKDAIFVAGLISTKNPLLEDHDFLKKRYAEARSVVGEQIALSPQCGFASVEEGNCIDEETQWKKIDLLVSCQDFL